MPKGKKRKIRYIIPRTHTGGDHLEAVSSLMSIIDYFDGMFASFTLANMLWFLPARTLALYLWPAGVVG